MQFSVRDDPPTLLGELEKEKQSPESDTTSHSEGIRMQHCKRVPSWLGENNQYHMGSVVHMPGVSM